MAEQEEKETGETAQRARARSGIGRKGLGKEHYPYPKEGALIECDERKGWVRDLT